MSRFVALDRHCTQWARAVMSSGGRVSFRRQVLVSRFIRAEKASGAWALTDDYWCLWAESETQALTSLKQRRLATAVAAPTFTADAGYAFNGTSQYLNTGFIPSTHGVNCTGTNQRLGVYERTNVSASGFSAATLDAATRVLAINNRNGTIAIGRHNSAAVNITLSLADSRGLKATSRASGGTTVKLYDRGVKLTDGTATSVGSAAPTRSIYIGAVNNVGTAAAFRAASIGFVVVGGPLSDAQETAHYDAVQAWATAVGANA